jgi:membrane dipeptidase
MSFDTTAFHEESGVFDGHSDILYTVVREHELGNDRVIEDEFLPEMRAGGIDMRVAAIYLDADQAREQATRRGFSIAESFRKEVEQSDNLELATTATDVQTGADSDAVTFILGMEGAEPLKGDRSMLDVFYRLGLRVLGLTHSRRNLAADGAFFEPIRSGDPSGLSAFGVEAVERCAELGIVVDVSHLNESGFRDVIEYSSGPVIASHSNCRALCDHPRNLWDGQLCAIADCGGVVGINALQAFLHDDRPDIGTVADQIEHVVDLVGIEHVGLGFDYYEYNLAYMSPAEQAYMIDVSTADGLGTDADVPNLTVELLERGFEPNDVRMILKGNFVRVFKEAMD